MDKLAARFLKYYQGDELRRITVLFALLVMAVGTLLSYAFASTIVQQTQRDFVDQSDQRASTLAAHFTTRMDRYQQLLYTGAGLFDVVGAVSPEAWRQFTQSSRLVEQYPAVLGFGYAAYDHNNASGTATITYLEPNNAINQKALGYDMMSESVRRAAIERARDQAVVSMSAPVTLIQDTDNPAKKGVLLYYPVYDTSAVHSTVEQRRQMIRGFVYIVMRPVDILQTVDRTTIDLDSLSYELKDGVTTMASQQAAMILTTDQSLAKSRDIALYGQTWRLDTTTYQPIWERYTMPAIILLLGIGLSLGISIGLYRLWFRSVDRLTSSHQEQLMKTRDELLALTSHQLRTPATGVKQYLGMLTQGFIGTLTPEQQAVAQKAYLANERQLETINQILHVAKADAGQLKIESSVIDLSALVRDVADGMASDAEKKSIRLRTMITDGVRAKVDERYIRMAIENLLSNAIKYSYEAGEVLVRLRTTQRWLYIAVSDHGVGVSAQDYDKLFIKFSRVANVLSMKEGGTGLGLYLSREIACAHGGRIDVRSDKKLGTVFTMALPAAIHKQPRHKGETYERTIQY